MRDGFIVSDEAFEINLDCFLNASQRLSLRFAFAVAPCQGRTEGMVAASRLLLKDRGIVHACRLVNAA